MKKMSISKFSMGLGKVLLINILVVFLKPAIAYELKINTLEASVDSCYPKILNAAIYQELNGAKITKSESAFDTQLNANSLVRQGSTYNTTYQKVALEKRFYGSPISAYMGYDISNGYTPQYDSSQVTSNLGREFIGLKVNLLNGFTMDEERVNLYNAILEKEKSSYELQLSKLVIKTEAIKAYLSWLIAGYQLKAYDALLQNSTKRQMALEKRLKLGDVAEFSVKENYNNVLKRKIKVVAAEDYFNKASQYLSLYYRNNNCNIVVPNKEMLPKNLPKAKTLTIASINDEVNLATQNRPEFKIIQKQVEQLLNQNKLSTNYLLPKLNFALQYNQNNSDTPTSSYVKLNQQEMVGKLEFSLPLERSYGKGMSEEVRSNLKRLFNDRKLLLDQLQSQLETLSYSVNATSNQSNMAVMDTTLTQELLNFENKRVQNGDSNFFMLNLREDNATGAYLNYIDGIASNYQAIIEYNFLTGKNIELTKAYPEFN